MAPRKRKPATQSVGEVTRPPVKPGTSLTKVGQTVQGITSPIRPETYGLTRGRNNRLPDDGFNGGFFPPLDPMSPQANEAARGRRFNYPTGINLTYGPRNQMGQNAISFELLRRFAEPAAGGLDIVRLLIERRKAQMKAQTFKIVGREKNDNGGEKGRMIEAFFRRPDGKRSWRAWLSSLLEDHFVIDAVAIYPKMSRGVPMLTQIDGATIDVLIDNTGDTPMPPLPAYQQILQGLPAVDYRADELAYYVANPRSNKLYGMSPVEQMVGIITISLNRQLSILNFFTAGSVPDMLIGVPETWNPDQIQQYQEWWDSVLAGNLAERRHARFIPGATKPYETKTEVMKDPHFDEWMARIACFCFGISPQSFVKEMNRATSETAKAAAAEEGLEPTKLFVKDVVDDLLERMGAGELEMKWTDEEIQDPIQKAEFAVALRGGATGSAKPVITLDEQRELLGLPPVTPEQLDELDPEPVEPAPMGAGPNGNAPVGAPVKQTNGAKPVSKAAAFRGGRSLPPVKTNNRIRRKIERAIRRVVADHLTAQRKAVTQYLKSHSTKLAKASLEDVHALMEVLRQTPWDKAAQAKLLELVSTLSREGATAGLDHVGDTVPATDDEFLALLDQANDRSATWAAERVGNLITEVDDTTRDIVNQMTSAAIEDGITNTELADAMTDAFGFSGDRAIMIARTETALAESQGTLIGFRESGVVEGKEWFPDEEACEICLGNADQGVIALDDDFESGDDAPPAHPNCECTLIPVVSEAAMGEDAEAA